MKSKKHFWLEKFMFFSQFISENNTFFLLIIFQMTTYCWNNDKFGDIFIIQLQHIKLHFSVVHSLNSWT